VDDECDETANDGAPCAAVRNDGTGNLVEREQKDDVGGETCGEEGVVDGVGGEGSEGGEGCEDDGAWREVRDKKAAEPRSEEGSDDAGYGTDEGFGEGWFRGEG